MSKDRMLRLFHADALDLLNITNSLKQVCEDLASPTFRMARKDIMPGCAIKMQLCQRANSLEEAFTRMRGKPFTTEVKLDGYRLQIHVKGSEVMYFSRRGREHGRLSDYVVFDEVVRHQVRLAEPGDAVILDGELGVWNKSRGVFEPFGGVRSAMNAARERVPPEHVLGTKSYGWQGNGGRARDGGDDADPVEGGSQQQQQQQEQEPTSDDDAPTAGEIELIYFAFDILFVGKESVITRSLHERHSLLKDALSCIPADQPGVPCNSSCVGGRIIALLPDQPLPLPLPGAAAVAPPPAAGVEAKEGGGVGGGAAVGCAAVPELVLSRAGRTLADMQRMYDVAISRQDEGIVCKQLESPWKPDDRSGSWVKMKPEYTGQQELDCVIIAVYLGGGHRGGQISEFLLALLEDVHAMRWCSFCKVGTGFSNVERQQLGERLQPFLLRNGPGVRPPACYKLSGKEVRPDFWVTNPQRSLVVEVRSDIRTIVSKVFATPYSLRFPRITKICWDRSAADISSCAEVERVVLENKGRLAERQAGVGSKGSKPGQAGRQAAAARAAAKRRQQRSGVVGAARLPDVSGVQRRSGAPLAGREVHVINYCCDQQTAAQRDAAKQRVGEVLARNGAKQVAAPLRTTDYVLARHLGEERVRWLHRAEGGSSTNAQAAYDVTSLAWLAAVDEAAEELPVM
ncbi:hypothetical protein COO60DRAFT_414207 [Scenedesmus sp. NREL 46B-D3]|nr:hypothetical protein COO60DRAFT_414207 [Scenedesmus sp. NREL 46B-D3]